MILSPVCPTKSTGSRWMGAPYACLTQSQIQHKIKTKTTKNMTKTANKVVLLGMNMELSALSIIVRKFKIYKTKNLLYKAKKSNSIFPYRIKDKRRTCKSKRF